MNTVRSAGYSLVELMVVVAVIGIMGGMTAPSLLDSIPAARTNGAARQVLGDLRVARTTAIQQGKQVVVSFDASAGAYDLAVDNDRDSTYSAGDALIKHVTLAPDFSGVDFHSNAGGGSASIALNASNAVAFRTNGSATGSDGYVYLMPHADIATSRQDRNRRVLLVTSTGNATVQSYDGTTWQ